MMVVDDVGDGEVRNCRRWRQSFKLVTNVLKVIFLRWKRGILLAGGGQR